MLFIVVLGFVVLSYLSYKFFIYPAFLSPLAAIPNAHFTSSFSNGWMIWQRYRGHPNRAIHDAHTRLGPVVRLGLTEISVNSVEGLNLVYSGNFEKDKFYIPFANYEYVQVSFSTRNSVELTSTEQTEYVFYGSETNSREAKTDVREHLQQICLAIVGSDSRAVPGHLH
jgi:hypothetical protein